MKRILQVALSLIIAVVILIGLYGATQTGDIVFIVAGAVGIVAWMTIVLRSFLHFDTHEHNNIL